ncbi:TetR family transcriptional regulator [Pseudonocardia sp. CA-107938]|uniref:TetR family transcriptional regulator n=1 Tax=Pseudonocardia sp. CA-107938 TaxID=3240021 RepID=UPI003D9063BB
MTVARRGRSEAGRAEVRRDLVAAAVALFADQGYDATTVDDIAAAAGVGRRTFFRYFRAKEEAVSPDHASALARVGEVFESAHPTESPAALALRAGETVFDLYTDDPALSVARYRITHDVPALRDRESASVDHYRRLFTRHLRTRLATDPDGDLRAAVIGSAVVAAHNLALRTWLAAGAPAGGIAAMVARYRAVSTMLPVEQPALAQVTERLEAAVVRLEQQPGVAR